MKWARAPHVLWRTAPGYLVLGELNGSTTEIVGPGGEIWQRLDQPIEEDTLVTELVEMYATDRSVVAADVEQLLFKLESAGYVDRLH